MATSLERFREYNFDGDERWTSYLRTVEFPSGANDGLLQRAKARWYKREVDPEVDIALLIPNSGGPPPPPQPAAAPPPPRPAPPPTATPPPAPAPRTSQAVTLPDTALFLGHLLLIVCAALTLQPLSPLLRYQGFYFACRASVFVHGFRLVRKLGTPALSFVGARAWVQRAAPSTELAFLIMASIMINNRDLWMGLAPQALLAAFHVAAFLQRSLGHTRAWAQHGQRPYSWLLAQREPALHLMALLEVGTGFQALLRVFSVGPSALITSFVVFNYLRGRFWSPEARTYHVAAWHLVNQRAQPLVARVPSLGMVVGYVVAWFQKPMHQHAQ